MQEWKKVNSVRRGVYNGANSCSNQFGRGREEFQLQCYSHIIPQTHILSSCIVWHLELLRQLRLKVLLKSNLLSPFVYFVGVPHFRQWKDILYLLLCFRADTRQRCLGSQQGGEIYTDFIFQQLPLCGLTIQKLLFFSLTWENNGLWSLAPLGSTAHSWWSSAGHRHGMLVSCSLPSSLALFSIYSWHYTLSI